MSQSGEAAESTSLDARTLMNVFLEEHTRGKYMPSKNTTADSGARQIFNEANALKPEDPPLCDPPLNDPRVDRWHILGATVFVALTLKSLRLGQIGSGQYLNDATLTEVAKKLCLCNNFIIGTHWQHSLSPESYFEGEKLVASFIATKTSPPGANPTLAQKKQARKVLGTIIKTHFPSEESSSFDGVLTVTLVYRMRKILKDTFESFPKTDDESY
jgi:hypothetical protein